MSIKRNGIAIILFSFLFLYSCGKSSNSQVKNNKTDPVVRDVFAMDTYMSLKAYGNEAEQAIEDSEKRIFELENELSTTLDSSDIWKLDNSNGESISVCDDTLTLIQKAQEIGNKTDGALDITVYPVLKEWGFTTGDYKIPEKNRLSELLKNVDYNIISVKGNSVFLPENVQIDLGALAKGYTGDEIMQIMKSHGVTSAIVSLGGNVQALGSKTDGSAWKVSVRDPFDSESDMCIVDIIGKAVITSGNYERFFYGDDGNKYWHIIDPDDGYPADNGLVSVTVIGDNGLECDALSTAFFVLGYDGTIDYLRSDPKYDVILVTDDKKIYYTDGLEKSFQNISGMPAEVISVD
ncbi:MULTISPECIES: FAD:protein FMN transferase [Ruminococcus]|uniref:FAD:protein FMN transferase n=1 Tax=Ruminococcus flavefaciens TaxID=1265 RepID=A0A1M7H8D1_RUMFL|nr:MULTISPECIES: FAD:protein FMN transferase [Ruminococcus]MCR4795288.1 FAD:protein FMN transferase [Ruminococcus sp.]SHM24750.1 thiamine biosynthesis lipoprotein [Ruminococcus flavefaciens]